jgi:multidrug efflux pump subunit AcrA (membrane-fusion protein)
MFGHLVRRLGLPGLGLGLILALVAQTGTPDHWLARCAIASSRVPVREKPTAPSAANSQMTTELRVVAEGRVVAYPGAQVIVGSEAAGRIVALPVEEKSRVRKGDLIAALNAADLEASLAEARARILETEADMGHDIRELKRELELVTRRAGTQQNLDSLKHDLETARARHAAATANRDRLKALIAKTRILAPIDGVVTARHVQPGETIETAARIVTIVDLNRLRVEAEVDEYDTARVSLEAPVTIMAEGFDSSWSGRIEEIPDTVVGRKLRPEDPGRPIDARVLPVKIALDGISPLKLGQRVEVLIDTPGSLTSSD